jgi:Fe2+ transport system protein FeoA
VGDANEAERLRDLGLREGATVTVLRDGDPLMVRVDDARFGIGRAAAEKILCHIEGQPRAAAAPISNLMSTETTTLDTLRPGTEAVVTGLSCEDEATERLMELGLIVGTPIKVIKFAPLGDPIEILMRGYHLTLRRAEAAGVVVTL